MSEFIEMLEELLPDGWEVADPEMGSDCLLVCPHGHTIEQDGICPDGCTSPLRELGLI
jgi:hypothetical protein